MFTILIGIEPPKTEIFYMTDPGGDEWGTYPTDAAFDGGPGLFDIMEFNVSANAYGTSFKLRLNNSVDPGWGAGNFSHQMFVILIDNAVGGTTEGVLAMNAEVQDEYPWDIGFYGDGFMVRYFTSETIAEPQTSGTGMTSTYEFVDGEHWYDVYVPETLIDGVADSTWKYYAMVASADYNDFRNHMAENGQWQFGGGDDSDYDPRWCDILVPASDDPVALQEFISSSYDVGSQTYAKMLAVGPGLTFETDTTVPLVSISAPATGATFTWDTGDTYTTEVTYTASDPAQGTYSGLATVKVYVNTVLVPEATSSPATVTLANGTNVIRVVATDKTGNTAYAEITVTVDDVREPATDDDTTPTDDDGGFNIPGYGIGFLLVTFIGSAVLLTRKRR
jgi:hypothetical protein